MGEGRGVERLTNDAGRGDEHLLRLAADGPAGRLSRYANRLVPLLTGEGVGVAGVDDERAGAAVA